MEGAREEKKKQKKPNNLALRTKPLRRYISTLTKTSIMRQKSLLSKLKPHWNADNGLNDCRSIAHTSYCRDAHKNGINHCFLTIPRPLENLKTAWAQWKEMNSWPEERCWCSRFHQAAMASGYTDTLIPDNQLPHERRHQPDFLSPPGVNTHFGLVWIITAIISNAPLFVHNIPGTYFHCTSNVILCWGLEKYKQNVYRHDNSK